MRVLVTAATRHGATAAIAQAIGRELTEAGLEADVRAPEEVESVEGYDAVVLGSAVYVGRWLPAATRFVEAHAVPLASRPVWLFSSGPIGAPVPKPEGEPEGLAALVDQLNARAHRVFPGRVERTSLSLGEKVVMKAVRAQYGDFRDWPAIASWAKGIASQLGRRPVTTGTTA